MRRLWNREERDTVVSGIVNGKEVSVVLNSGASVSVVPENMVGEEMKTGEFVSVMAFQSEVPVRLPLARVVFRINHLEWEEEVALAPVVKGQPGEVLCRFDVRSERGWELAGLVRKQDQVLRVTTRSETERESSEKQKEDRVLAVERPQVRRPKEKAVESVVMQKLASEDVDPGEGKSVADRPAGNPEPGPVENESVVEDDEEEDSSAEEEDLLGGSELFEVKPKGKEEKDLVIPPVKAGSGSRAELIRELKSDPSLEKWRALADKEEQGFCWDEGMMYQAVTTHTLEVAHLMVLPRKFRGRVMNLAHERSGHLGARKVKALVKQRFVWPEMAKDIVGHCQSCEICQTCKKSKARRVPLMEREVLSEPFEVLAMDEKEGRVHLLTDNYLYEQ